MLYAGAVWVLLGAKGSGAMNFCAWARKGGQVQKVIDQAEIHRKVVSGDVEERRWAAGQLNDNFADLPDKELAWKDLIRLTQDDWFVRLWVEGALDHAFQHVPDKKQAWDDLIRLTESEASYVQLRAAYALGSAFQYVHDKEEAWRDLHQLVGAEDVNIRYGVAVAIGSAFQYVHDKKQAWDDLILMTWDEDLSMRLHATATLSSVFQYVSEKDEAWDDLIRLTNDEEPVRMSVAVALGSVFQYVSEKDEAWKDLIWLTNDEDSVVRLRVVYALGSAFKHVPAREEAWRDLHRLTDDEDGLVRWGAASVIGAAFQHVPDKTQAWDDLIRLTADEDRYLRASANHSLGRASIFKATEAEDEGDFKSELKNAIEFFERSSKEATYSNPSRFCLPFYRSFYSLMFEKAGAEGEVKRYLAEAKSASEESENKETLIEAVENLANALSEAQKVTDFDATKFDLNACRRYCDRAADLIGDAADGAPGAARILRRRLPVIDNRIMGTIREIQEKAGAVCRETQCTSLEELGRATARSAQELPTQNPLALAMSHGSMASSAMALCELITTDDERIHACEQLKNLNGLELSEQGRALAGVLEYITACLHSHHNEPPPTKTVHISETQKDVVRIAVAQFCFELTESFPFTVNNRDEVKTKIFSALEIAKHDGANIVCLPELCLCEKWISEIEERYHDMIIIGGSFYKDKMNICPVIMKSDADTHYQPKITPSRNEDPEMTGEGMVSGDTVYIYETRFGRFMVLICRDFDHLLTQLVHQKNLDMIFCPAFNPGSANKRFHNAAHLHVEKNPLYILIANTGKYGGTSVFGRLHKDYFGLLVDNKCKEAGDSTYKLCEVKEGQEEVILADFNLIHKSVQAPTSSDPNEEIKSVNHIKKIPIQPDRLKI